MRTRVGPIIGSLTLAAGIGALWWVRRHPSPLPYTARVVVQAPHPGITRRRLLNVLAPRAGEHILEIGPGTGHYSVSLAQSITEAGHLHLLDLEQDFLDHTIRVAAEHGLHHLTPTRGDAQALPYPDSTFDAVCLIATLGEIPDQHLALQEIARVLRPSGRLVVGEYLLDVDRVSTTALRARATQAGLTVIRLSRTPIGYFATLRDPDQTRASIGTGS